LISIQSALGDVAEVKGAVGFAEIADVSDARFLLHYMSISGVRCCIRRDILKFSSSSSKSKKPTSPAFRETLAAEDADLTAFSQMARWSASPGWSTAGSLRPRRVTFGPVDLFLRPLAPLQPPAV
jgi:hypothetical protein